MSEQLKKWLAVALLAASWLTTAVAATKWGEMSARMNVIEQATGKKVDRTEYDATMHAILDRLDRIDNKLDRTFTQSGGTR